MVFRTSQYAHLMKVGRPILYHALTTKTFLLSPLQANALLAAKDRLVPDCVFDEHELSLLARHAFVVLDGETEPPPSQFFAEPLDASPEVFVLYLSVTDHCNLDCDYCFQRQRRSEGARCEMTREVVSQALDRFYAKEVQRQRQIILHGGEPMLNGEAVRQAVTGIRQTFSDNDADIVVFTNGTLFTYDWARFFNDMRVTPIVSVDGDKAIHDRFRRDIDGRGSYDRIRRGVDLLGNHSVRIAIAATIGAHNVEQLPDVFAYLADSFNPFSIGMNPIHYPPPGLEHVGIDYHVASQALVEVFKMARSRGIQVEQAMRRVRPFVLAKPRLKYCSACGAAVCVRPDGRFGPCDNCVDNDPASGDTSLPFADTTLIGKWNTRLSPSMQGCQACPALALCGGGCTFNAMKKGGTLLSPTDRRTCIQAETFLGWLLEDLAKGIPATGFHEVTLGEKARILGQIDLATWVPISSYSAYGEFTLKDYLR